MIWFYLKKNFCDAWDNLLSMVLYNLVALALFFSAYFFAKGLLDFPLASILTGALFLLLLIVYLFAVNKTMAKYADFKFVSFKETLLELPSVIKDALLFTALIAALVFLGYVGIPFYLRLGGLMGIFLASVVFWLLLLAVLSLQWFMPIKSQLNDPFVKAVKKCFLIFFDNAGFSIFMMIYAVLLTVISIFTGTILPGFSGVILAYNNAFRLRLYKYDWLDEHKDIPLKQARKQIPWAELLEEDNDTLGPRDLKSMIFPWK
ncbi:MAG: hypothetical protein MJ196_10285 [Treponemataceae bacterium]|nr:hypothetical protein [Treponemataceae bacterium]